VNEPYRIGLKITSDKDVMSFRGFQCSTHMFQRGEIANSSRCRTGQNAWWLETPHRTGEKQRIVTNNNGEPQRLTRQEDSLIRGSDPEKLAGQFLPVGRKIALTGDLRNALIVEHMRRIKRASCPRPSGSPNSSKVRTNND